MNRNPSPRRSNRFKPSILAAAVFLSSMRMANAAEPPAPFGAVPHERQVAWQRMEYYGFVHFGLNTWTDREWGYGDEDGKLFNPASFDARVIVRQFKEAGMKGLILTAKHHDGFCLWPTRSTPHNISKSPWKEGKGDVLKEFASACRAEGMKLGLYVSPWDRNHAEYGREGYVTVYHQQLREVLTNYGPVFEIWFDGANGGDGYYGGAREERTISDGYYRFPEAVDMIRELQPGCVIWGAGDARWGGSEQGDVGYPQWHTMDSTKPGNIAIGVRHGDLWVPAEGDVSIRPGWFWHESEDTQVRTPENLLQIWFDCVGRGANLILNVPPDRDGKLREGDLRSLLAFRKLRDECFSRDLAAGAKADGPSRGGSSAFAGSNLTDGRIDSYWTCDDGTTAPAATIRLPKEATFDVVRLREAIRLGQRVDAFCIDAWTDGKWTEIHAGKTIGNQVLVRLPHAVTAGRLQLRITEAAAVPCIAEFSLFKLPDIRATDPSAAAAPGKLEKTGWKIVDNSVGAAEAAIDDDPDTLWHTHMQEEMPPPQGFAVDMGREIRIAAFTYLPRQDGVADGMTDRYRFQISGDGAQWQTAAEGEFANLRANPIEQTVRLKTPLSARFFRFTGLHALEKNHVSAAEVGVVAAP